MPDYQLAPAITSLASDSLNIYNTIGREYKVTQCRIKEGKLLISTVKGEKDSSFFIIVDLRSHRLEHVVADPSNDYTVSVFDISRDSLFTMSSFRRDTLYVTSLQTGATSRYCLNFKSAISPGEILYSNGLLFLFKEEHGVTVIDVKDLHKIFIHEDNTGGISSESSTISMPVNTSLHLLTGYASRGDSIKLCAIDSLGSVKWEHVIRNTRAIGDPILLAGKEVFFVKDGDTFFALDQVTGNERWRDASGHPIFKAIEWHDKILIWNLENPTQTFGNPDTCEYQMKVRLLDGKDGKEVWENRLIFKGIPSIGIFNDQCLASDRSSFTIFSIETGRQLTGKQFTDEEKDHYSFEVLPDLEKGSPYLRSYNDVIYWK